MIRTFVRVRISFHWARSGAFIGALPSFGRALCAADRPSLCQISVHYCFILILGVGRLFFSNPFFRIFVLAFRCKLNVVDPEFKKEETFIF